MLLQRNVISHIGNTIYHLNNFIFFRNVIKFYEYFPFIGISERLSIAENPNYQILFIKIIFGKIINTMMGISM